MELWVRRWHCENPRRTNNNSTESWGQRQISKNHFSGQVTSKWSIASILKTLSIGKKAWETYRIVDLIGIYQKICLLCRSVFEDGRLCLDNSNVTVAQYTSIPVYWHTSIPVYRYTSVRVPICCYNIIPLYWYTGIPEHWCINIPAYRCTDTPV